jgi:hypothetical protein
MSGYKYINNYLNIIFDVDSIIVRARRELVKAPKYAARIDRDAVGLAGVAVGLLMLKE